VKILRIFYQISLKSPADLNDRDPTRYGVEFYLFILMIGDFVLLKKPFFPLNI
jgi:hypothetical protein